MPLTIIRADITTLKCDAIVNAANNTLLGGGGVDGAIHRAAGKELFEECRGLGGCETGNAKITLGYKLPSKFVIHTVGPVWYGGNRNEKQLLESCYINSLNLAKKHNCESVAFPLISSGIYGYPKADALRVATDVITEFLENNEMQVYITVFDKLAFEISEGLYHNVTQYIDDNYADERIPPENFSLAHNFSREAESKRNSIFSRVLSRDGKKQVMQESVCEEAVESSPLPSFEGSASPASLDGMLESLDESFSQMLLRKIDEKNMTDAQCYKKANIDRKLFSKIRNNIHYNPKKTTAIAFAVALELNIEETRDLLMKAGYALSHSNKFDVIIEYFILNRNYNIFEINEVLFKFDQMLLGA